MNKEFIKNNWTYLLVLLLLFIPLFQHLGSLTIRIWDESRLAINAYEMYHNGNFLIPTFNGEPDMWNTKPPLMIWLQVLSMKLFGIEELTLRLPSALAALFTGIALLLLSVRYLKNFWFGFICVLVLVTSNGYMDAHAARTGDYDTLLVLFLTVASFSLFAFLETAKNKYLYFFYISLTLALLTKSSAALMILPGLFIYVLIKKKILFLLKNKHFYAGLVGFVVIGGGYYFLREIYNPGYINAVLKNEFGGRFLESIEGHKHSFWYYYENLINNRFKEWILLIPCGIFVGAISKDKRIKNVTLFSTIIAITFFLIISLAQTKLYWYDLPLYPFLSVLASVFIYFIFSFLKDEKRISHYLKYNVIPFVFLFLLFIMPYKQVINKTYKQVEYSWDEDFYRINYYLRDILKGKRDVDNFTILYDGYLAHTLFYLNLLNEKGKNISLNILNENVGDISVLNEKGKNISYKRNEAVKAGEIILTFQDEIKKFLEEKYCLNVIEEYYNIKVYEILAEK